MTRYINEVYWKSCYAHAHNFDIEFIGTVNVSGVKSFSKDDGWYSDEMMWGYLPRLREHLVSGKYDHVFYLGADVLIQEAHLDFPAWFWNKGHDLTIMDQSRYFAGYNLNALVFKATEWSVKFLDTLYEHRKYFNLQGDNGAYMETILQMLSLEYEELHGVSAYDGGCSTALRLEKPTAVYLATNDPVFGVKLGVYTDCFFNMLDRMAGVYGQRNSKHIGFTSTIKQGHLPWANCWSYVRASWGGWDKECFALHWNGPKYAGVKSEVTGKCPVPSFDWDNNPYNVNNPNRPKFIA